MRQPIFASIAALFLVSLFGSLSGCAHTFSEGGVSEGLGLEGGGAVKIDILRTDIMLDLAPGLETVTGRQSLVFVAKTGGWVLAFDTGDIRPLAARLDGVMIETRQGAASAKGMSLTLADTLEPGSEHVFSIDYEATPTRSFTNGPALMASAYFACDWMICNQEDFADRFTAVLTLNVPAEMNTLGPGTLIETAALEGERLQFTWQTATPFPAYTHSFAVGELNASLLPSDCAPALRIAAPETSAKTMSELARAFAPTCDMLEFFEAKAGVAFPHESYTQLYVPGSRAAQEAISHSKIGGVFLDPIMDDPQEDWVIAHELAHQWWGNRVTAESLSEFWLNEGIVTFMVAAWKGEKWGQAAYDREIGLNRARWQRRVEDGGDFPLAFAGTYPSVGVRFTVQYAKGAVFLHELKAQIGEEAFWAGFGAFTRAGFDKSVASKDFQEAMQAQTDMALGPIFAQWVYGD